MKRSWIFSIAVGCACFCPSLFSQAQQTTVPANVTDAKQILSSILLQSGSVSGIHLAGTARAIAGSTDEAGTFAYDIQADGTSQLQINAGVLSRNETTSPFNDHPRWTWSGKDEVEHESAGHNCLIALDWVLPAYAIAKHSASLQITSAMGQPTTLEFRRTPAVGTPKWRQSAANLSAVSLAVDPNTSYPTEVRFNLHPDDDASTNIPVRVLYSDYRQVNGVTLPFHIQKFLNNSLVLDLQVESASSK
jgi:hypothetical protein